MDILSYDQLERIAGSGMSRDNAISFLAGLNTFGRAMGLNQPHRLAIYVAQMSHESGAFRHDREVWGPTAAQKRYEGRRDLGNTQPGDGFKMRGRTGIQITGRYNYQDYTRWARKLDPAAPDFETDPDKVLTDPWEGLGPIWYWDTRKLNQLADHVRFKLAFKNVTRRINGRTNGYSDRLRHYQRAALVLLGYTAIDVRGFQAKAGLTVDGKCGPLTRQALHDALRAQKPIAAQSLPVFRRLWAAIINLFS